MKKYIFFICVLLVNILVFSSCSKNEENESGQDTIDINGTKYSLGVTTLMGIWSEESKSGDFTISINYEKNGTTLVYYYKFEFENSTCPKVGDDLSKMPLLLYAGDDNGSLYKNPLNYVSGSAKVVGLNKAESEMTIKFDQLKMNRGDTNYTFTGTVTVLFTDNW